MAATDVARMEKLGPVSARQLAYQAFQSEHPLRAIYELSTGRWSVAVSNSDRKFSLAALTRFAETLPQYVIDGLAEAGSTQRAS